MAPKSEPPPKATTLKRLERSGAALRANLKKRKDLARTRTAAPAAPAAPPAPAKPEGQ